MVRFAAPTMFWKIDAGEDARVLDHYAELAADDTGIELGQALAVVGDRSRLRALEPEQEAKDRRLPRSRRADDGDELAGLRRQRDVVEHRWPFAAVAEGDVRELDRAAKLAGVGAARPHLGRAFDDRPGTLPEDDGLTRRSEHAGEAEDGRRGRRKCGREGDKLACGEARAGNLAHDEQHQRDCERLPGGREGAQSGKYTLGGDEGLLHLSERGAPSERTLAPLREPRGASGGRPGSAARTPAFWPSAA